MNLSFRNRSESDLEKESLPRHYIPLESTDYSNMVTIKLSFAELKLGILGFPGGSVVRNLPASAGDMNSIPDLGRFHMPWSNKAWGPQLLSLCFSAWEPQLLKTKCPKAHALQQEKLPQREVQAPQLESSLHLMQLEKSRSSNKDTVKIKFKKEKKENLQISCYE